MNIPDEVDSRLGTGVAAAWRAMALAATMAHSPDLQHVLL